MVSDTESKHNAGGDTTPAPVPIACTIKSTADCQHKQITPGGTFTIPSDSFTVKCETYIFSKDKKLYLAFPCELCESDDPEYVQINSPIFDVINKIAEVKHGR